jgi:hypothetical protein
MSNYSKNLAGVNQKVFVSPAIEYTDDTTYTAFITNSVEGEIGVFLDTGAVRTTLLTSGLKFFIAQKKDGSVEKTPLITFGTDTLSLRRTAYDAPVKKVVSVGYPASGTTTLSFDFTGASLTNTLTFGISASETTPGNQPFPVQEGYATVNSTTADQYSVLAAIVSQLNGDYDYERTQPDKFVLAEIQANGTVTALGQTAAVTTGSTSVTAGAAVTLADRSFLSLAGVVYRVNGAVSASTAIVLDRPYQGASATLASGTGATQAGTMAYTSGTTLLGVRLTSISTDTHFVARGIAGLYLSPVTTITAWKLGAGSGNAVLAMEQEGRFFEGIGSVVNAKFASDYGLPTLFANTSLTYDQFFLDFSPSITPSAALPHYTTKQIERIAIAAPTGGTTPGNELQTIFGL